MKIAEGFISLTKGNLIKKGRFYTGANISSSKAQGLVYRYIKSQSTVLEFGAATGILTQHLKTDLECEVTIVEIDPLAAKEASKWAKKTVVADIEDYTWQSEISGTKFDYILFADVLEHLKDPWSVLRVASELLKSDGRIVISLPNIAHSAVLINLWLGRFVYTKYGILDNTHLRHFTLDTIIEMLNKTGLTLVDLGTIQKMPEETGVGCSYGEVPFGIGLALSRRPNAHVFQYVLIAEKDELEVDTFPKEIKDVFCFKDFLREYIKYRLRTIKSALL